MVRLSAMLKKSLAWKKYQCLSVVYMAQLRGEQPCLLFAFIGEITAQCSHIQKVQGYLVLCAFNACLL